MADVYQVEGPFPTFDTHLTAEDRLHLASLEPHQVQQWTKAKTEEIIHRACSLRSVCNAMAPINRKLPFEVLMEVFSHLEPSFQRQGQLNFLHVCRLWRHLLIRSATFWVRVVRGFRFPQKIRSDGVALFQSFLRLTRDSPLEMTLDYVDPAIARTLVPCASRIVSLAISIYPEGMNHVYAWLEQESLPLLECLDMSHRLRPGDRVPSHPKLVLHRGRFPRLRSFRHPIGPMDVSSLADQLQYIALFECRSCHSFPERLLPSLTAMLLERCASLHTFCLELDSTFVLRTADNRIFSLPSLRLLRIRHSHTSDFLTHLALPDACVVELESSTTRIPSMTDLLPRDLAAFHQLRRADRVRARVLTPAASRFHKVVEVYAGGSKTLSVECLSLIDNFMPDGYRSLLPFMPRLRSIAFEDDARYIVMMLGKLSESGACICPQLEELDALWLPWHDEFFKGPDIESRKLSSMDAGSEWYRRGPIVLAVFCAYVRRMLLDRAAAGSAGLRKIHVRVPAVIVSAYIDEESWAPPKLKERMLAQLGPDFAGELAVSFGGLQ